MNPITPLNVRDYITGEQTIYSRWYYIKPSKVNQLMAPLSLFDISTTFILEASEYIRQPAVFIDGKYLCK